MNITTIYPSTKCREQECEKTYNFDTYARRGSIQGKNGEIDLANMQCHNGHEHLFALTTSTNKTLANYFTFQTNNITQYSN
jgi:GH25 family lysozyme M1 (1,4-beta-N-acetylmuramidase)